MPRARSISQDQRQTAAASENGSGCFSVFWMTPVAALFIACVLAIFALRAPLPTSALNNEVSASPVFTSTPQSQTLVLPVATHGLPVADNTNIVVPTSAANMNAVSEAPQASNNPFFSFSVAPSTSSELPGSSSNGISPIFSREVQYWAKDIVRWANQASIDPNLVAVVMQIESCGDPRAISRAGAMGLFQVMPFHFHITDNPFDPDTNALRGMDYLSRSLEAAGGNPRLALAGYNGGVGVISRDEWTWPAETHRYVKIGVPLYEDARSGASSSPTMDQWYGRGTSLCRQARNRLGLSE